MNLDAALPVYVFDTCALLDYAVLRGLDLHRFNSRLSLQGQCVYHPISLAELADYTHAEIWNDRQPRRKPVEIRNGITLRRNLLRILADHRMRDDPTQRLYGRRFLPGEVTFEHFALLARQRQGTNFLRMLPRGQRLTLVADLTDHQILTLAFRFQERGFRMTFVSSDIDLLGAAHRLGLDWYNPKDGARDAPYPWE